jgi:inosine-uridine nucleoside N-ribohydrolase
LPGKAAEAIRVAGESSGSFVFPHADEHRSEEARPRIGRDAATMISRLEPPEGPSAAVMDTDAANEIDDQFAIAYAALAPTVDLQAVYAAPFLNEMSSSPGDGMRKSLAEIERVMAACTQLDPGGAGADRRSGTRPAGPRAIPILAGSHRFLSASSGPVESDAARDLIARAHSASVTLYVVAIGAPTNIASAIMLDPSIRDRIVVIWLGGNQSRWHETATFNMAQDFRASRYLFDCGVPIVHVPCKNGVEHLRTTVWELTAELDGRNAVCSYLCEITRRHQIAHGWRSRSLADVGAVAWLRDPTWCQSRLGPSPIITQALRYSRDPRRHLYREIVDMNRDAIFRDMFQILARPS